MSKSALKECCCIRDTSFSEIKRGYELDPCSVVTDQGSHVLAIQPYNIRSVPGQWNFTHDLFRKINIEDAVRVVSSFAIPGAHVQVLCSALMLFH